MRFKAADGIQPPCFYVGETEAGNVGEIGPWSPVCSATELAPKPRRGDSPADVLPLASASHVLDFADKELTSRRQGDFAAGCPQNATHAMPHPGPKSTPNHSWGGQLWPALATDCAISHSSCMGMPLPVQEALCWTRG